MEDTDALNFMTGYSVNVHRELNCDFQVPYLDYVMFLCLRQATNEQKLKAVLHFHRLLKDKSPVPPSLLDLPPLYKKWMLARCTQQDAAYPPYEPKVEWADE